MKRFQECNNFEKLWRYRWYLLIPFWIIGAKLRGSTHSINMLRKLFIGIAQSHMEWYYTQEEVEKILDDLRDKNGI